MRKNNEIAICFFSGTGNSFDITKRLSQALGGTSLYNIATMQNPTVLIEYKRVGFVFPVYGFTMPNIVKRFLESLPINGNTYYFAVLTKGAFALGADRRMQEVFKKAGGKLNYITYVYMPENYILFSNLPSEKIVKTHLENSKRRVADIAKDVLSGKMKRAKITPIDIMFGNIIKNISRKESQQWHETAKKFTVSGTCTGCNKCAKLCPVNNITMSDGKPVFDNHCECCLACIHSCPTQAIQAERTVGKKRYTNPNVNLIDMKKF
jgi:ferredoxin/flavodoxin